MELSPELRHIFVDIYRSQDLYRATGVILMELTKDANIQYTLFEDALKQRGFMTSTGSWMR